MPLEITNIERAKKVLVGNLIKNATHIEIKDKLKVIYLMIGLRVQHWPEDEEKEFLINYIMAKYGNKTLSELVLAFDLAIQGQLDIDDAKVYDQFSCEYLAKIMNGYRVWLKLVTKNAHTIQPKEQMLLESKDTLTADEWDEWINDAKSYPFELIPNAIYEFLVKQGSLNLSVKEKHEMMDKAINYASSRIEGKEFTEFMQMKHKGVFSGHYLATLITLSKRFAVKQFFESQT